MRTLYREDVTFVRDALGDAISSHLSRSISQDGQALGGEFVGVLAAHVLVPVLVSLVSSALYDLIKAKTLGSLTTKDVDDLVDSLIGRRLKREPDLDGECLAHLRQELEPLGMTEAQIIATYESIQRHLLSKERE